MLIDFSVVGLVLLSVWSILLLCPVLTQDPKPLEFRDRRAQHFKIMDVIRMTRSVINQ